MKIYQVGGAVRDILMRQTPHDIDYVVVGATPAAMLAAGYKQIKKDIPVFINPEDGREYALARRETKTGCRHDDFRFETSPDITLAEDLIRRDFTCNAIARDPQTGEIIDPYNGTADIHAKVLRHINAEHFVEDPLRVLRLCRFTAQLDFTPAPETLELARQMTATGMLTHLSGDRICQELFKALDTPRPDVFFRTAIRCGALAAVLPEINQLFATPERPDYHPEGNSGEHILLCLQHAVGQSLKVKLAVLLHDLGKTVTPPDILPAHHGHAEAGIPLVRKLCQRLNIPNELSNFAVLCCAEHMKLTLVRQMRLSKLIKLITRLQRNHDNNIPDFIHVCTADFLGRRIPITMEQRQTLAADIRYLRRAARILNRIKATDMPNFSSLPKDKTFAEHWHNFQIEMLRRNLKSTYPA